MYKLELLYDHKFLLPYCKLVFSRSGMEVGVFLRFIKSRAVSLLLSKGGLFLYLIHEISIHPRMSHWQKRLINVCGSFTLISRWRRTRERLLHPAVTPSGDKKIPKFLSRERHKTVAHTHTISLHQLNCLHLPLALSFCRKPFFIIQVKCVSK